MNYNEFKEKQSKKLSKIFEETGSFFAFSDKQFNEQKKEGEIYVTTGAGMLLPKRNIDKYLKLSDQLNKESKKYIQKNKNEVIRYELNNHEACYTGDIENTYEALKDYDITRSEVLKVFKETGCTCENH